MYKDSHIVGATLRTNLLQSTDLENLRKSFIETLTHDLKTPVLAQIRAIELLLNEHFGKFNNEQSEMLKLTLESCKYMYEMVSTLISTYRYESEEFELNYSLFNIMRLIEEDIANLQPYLTAKNIKVVIIPDIKTPMIAGDLIRLQKVIQTLLFNSLNSAFKNSIIKIYLKTENKKISVKFESHGGYITREKMEKMFQIYTFHTEKFDKIGAGIGLYLVKKIIDKHHGHIIAESDVRQKNILGFEIPTEAPQELYYEQCI